MHNQNEARHTERANINAIISRLCLAIMIKTLENTETQFNVHQPSPCRIGNNFHRHQMEWT